MVENFPCKPPFFCLQNLVEKGKEIEDVIYIYILYFMQIRISFLTTNKRKFYSFSIIPLLYPFCQTQMREKKQKTIFSVLCIFFISSTFSSSQSNIMKLDKRRNVKFFWVILELMFYAILKILSAY